MKLMMCVALGGALVGTVANADTVAPRPLPKVDKNVVVQTKIDAQNAEKNKLQAFVLTADATNSDNTKTFTQHGPYAPPVRDPLFLATRVFGRSFAPLMVMWPGHEGRTTWALQNTAPAGTQVAAPTPGDAINLIGNLAERTQGKIHWVSINGSTEIVPNVTTSAPHLSYIHHDTVNGKPNALVFATPRGNAANAAFAKPYGVTFDTSKRMWALVTEDKAAWDAGKGYQFNLGLIEKPTITGPVRAFRFTVDSKNPDGPTRLPKTMAGKDDVVVLQHVVDAKGIFVNEPIAVGLEPDTGLWTITTPSRKIPDGAVFNVLVVKKTK